MRLIEVLNYRPEWASDFEHECQHLNRVLGSLNPSIHHIGSTSVAGLPAKPVIDILIEVENVASLDPFDTAMAEIGYLAKGEFGISGRRHYQKGQDARTHHIHAFSKGDEHITRHLAFRDYLRVHKRVAEEYGQLKQKIAAQCGNSIEKYCADKNDFIQYHEKRAIDWYCRDQ